MNSRIVSTGMYVPPKVVTNFDLEKMMDTSDDWIKQRSGIKERRWVEPGETTLSMAAKASLQALERANLKPDDIDMIIFGCLVSDYIFPGTGCLLQKELGFTRTIPALDIRNQCSGFVYSISLADALIKSGQYKRILIVGSEVHSTSLDKTTRGRDVSVLFGDGAGAMIVESCDNSQSKIIDSELHSEGQYAESLAILKPSPNDFPRLKADSGPGAEIYPYMDGKLVFKNAVIRMTEVMKNILNRNSLTTKDVDFVIAHQANMRINQMVLNQLEMPFEKTHHTLDRYGNTTMATIPITFDEAVLLGKIKRGDLVVFVAFGAGFTWGANLLRY
ncbi:MAG: 3-oxoacyl-ACP synthase [Bdellovibrionales bacterium RBG_16_40_8]|nr:MAG: 3-oxoacyl-ACP synthase [Bdellovibrionales bacterium RBG_16_40_8]